MEWPDRRIIQLTRDFGQGGYLHSRKSIPLVSEAIFYSSYLTTATDIWLRIYHLRASRFQKVWFHSDQKFRVYIAADELSVLIEYRLCSFVEQVLPQKSMTDSWSLLGFPTTISIQDKNFFSFCSTLPTFRANVEPRLSSKKKGSRAGQVAVGPLRATVPGVQATLALASTGDCACCDFASVETLSFLDLLTG